MNNSAPDEELWYGPDWCDFRWRISGCKGAQMWKGFNIARAIIYGLLFPLGCWILHKKLEKAKKNWFYEIVDGAVKVKATEMFVITSILHCAGKSIFSIVILSGGFGSQTLTEIFHDLPWTILFSGCCFYTVGIIQGTPRSYVASNTKTVDGGMQVNRIRLPGPMVQNTILAIFSIVILIISTILGAVTGRAVDQGDFIRATKLVHAHYIFWGVYNVGLSSIGVYFGLKMWTVLKHAKGVAQVEDAQFKRIIMQIIINLVAIVVGLSTFAVALLVYGIFRTEVHSIMGLGGFLGFCWFFTSALCIGSVFIAIPYNMHKHKKEISSGGGISDQSSKSGKSSGPGKTRAISSSEP